MIIVLMGVAGSGKTTIGAQLAQELNWAFYDGDSFHPESNVAKMAQGIALTNEDRTGWLHRLRALIDDLVRTGMPAVITCSALKESYRQMLRADGDEAHFVYLRGTYQLIKERLERRRNHFMPAGLLASQFEALEEPDGVLTIDVSQQPDAIVRAIRRGLGV